MTLNPIIALSDQLQKLINERGSAAILRDHLSWVKDQVIDLEKKLAVSESENANLKTRSEQLAQENAELKQKIQEYENPPQSNLPDNEVNILTFLFRQGINERTRAEQITRSIKTDLQRTEYYLGELKNKEMIQDHYISGNDYMGTPSYRYWTLTHEGRRYLIEHKLI